MMEVSAVAEFYDTSACTTYAAIPVSRRQVPTRPLFVEPGPFLEEMGGFDVATTYLELVSQKETA